MVIPFLRRAFASDPDHIVVRHGDADLKVRLRRHAAARRFTLRVSGATGEIVLTLPQRGSLETARHFAQGHGAWIAARLEKLSDRTAFAPGEKVPVRGRMHRIVHRPAPRGVVTAATDAAGHPILAVYGDAAHVARRVRDFLSKEAKRDLDIAVLKYTRLLGIPARKITIKDTRSRWGSCSSAGRLNFSWRLIMAPPEILDYLAAHEVAHLKEMNHSARFWRIVAKSCPHWREAERWLKRHGAELHRYG